MLGLNGSTIFRSAIGGAQAVIGVAMLFVWNSTLSNRDTLNVMQGQISAISGMAVSIGALDGRLREVEGDVRSVVERQKWAIERMDREGVEVDAVQQIVRDLMRQQRTDAGPLGKAPR